MISIHNTIAKELSVEITQINSAVKLLDEGNTVPFISRYRKELTRGLTDSQLRVIETRLQYLRELEERKEVILKSIKEQGKLTEELEKKIVESDNKARLEDLYRPYKPKRRTKGTIAKEAGLEPFAKAILENQDLDIQKEASKYLNPEKEIKTEEDAITGAKYILMEYFAYDADLLEIFREKLWEEGIIISSFSKEDNPKNNKYADYKAHQEAIKKIPSHRLLALLRGRKESVLKIKVQLKENTDEIFVGMIVTKFGLKSDFLKDLAGLTWRTKILQQLEVDVISSAKKIAEEKAIQVFAENLKDILLASPAGAKVTMGLDPGLKTGVKLAIVNETGKVVDYGVIYPNPPQNQKEESKAKLIELCKKHNVSLISIGNGTGSKETDSLVSEIVKELGIIKTVVSEAGASVYSASEIAEQEFPDLDVTIRGAISIARRLQDPLSELVKIEPKSIGVGQYQHDVSQTLLSKMLKTTVEDCVNSVGVDLNTASASLLTYISGLNKQLAKNIVEYRNQNGAYKNREDLKKVEKFGDKTFEQSAGFLRILNGDSILDRSSVHPESYEIVEKIVNFYKKELSDVIGNASFLSSVDVSEFTEENKGEFTVKDILTELEKPGRDPRPEFKSVNFIPEVNDIKDVETDMILEGIVTNVANFGAFVDIGIKQDGLVHISEITNQYIKNPRDVVKTGDIVKVKVLEIDKNRNRISLTMKLTDKKPVKKAKPAKKKVVNKKPIKTSEFAKTLFAAINKEKA